jgi:uncharacterized membrane-anchored protein
MKLKLFILVLALQTAWLLAIVVMQEFALAHGKVILLETQRIDPRDMLRGDYLILNYKISDVPGKLFSSPVKNDLAPGTKIFVALAPGTNQFYEITRASTNAFAPTANEILLKGKSANRWWNATNSVHVTYGIENYFVAEGTGNPTGKLTVQVIVPASGHPKIAQVFVDGKPYAEVMKQ